jgi:xylulokinase
MYYIGIDLGTSAVKMLLMDSEGQCVGSVSKEYPISFPQPGWSEQNPQDWLDAVIDGVRELVDADDDSACGCEEYEYSAKAKQVAAISFGGQMHGLVILDENDEVIRPAILWNDGRTAKECDYLNNEIGRDKLTEYTANIAFAGFTAPKLLWLRENEPENFAKIKKIMLPKDYIAYKLTGVHSTDVSDASGTLLFNVKNRTWSDEMIKICGIEKNQLPNIYESSDCIGTLTPLMASKLRLPAGVKVAAGAGDNAAAAVGTGTVGNGKCNISIGTSGTIFISSSEFGVDKNNALHSFAHADGSYHLMGCMLSAASCNKWWMDEIIKTGDYAGEQAQIDDEKLGRNHVYFLPYLAGERSPHNDPLARATFTGMTMDTTRADMTQAVLEGVAFAIRDSFEAAKSLGINIESATLCGGGAKSPLWRRIIANVLGVSIVIPKVEEGPSLGAAILAMVAAGEYEDVKSASEALFERSEVIEPEREVVSRYNEKYESFKLLYPALKPAFNISTW